MERKNITNLILQTLAKYTPKKIRYFILIDSWAEYTIAYPKKEAPACSMQEVMEYFGD